MAGGDPNASGEADAPASTGYFSAGAVADGDSAAGVRRRSLLNATSGRLATSRRLAHADSVADRPATDRVAASSVATSGRNCQVGLRAPARGGRGQVARFR